MYLTFNERKFNVAFCKLANLTNALESFSAMHAKLKSHLKRYKPILSAHAPLRYMQSHV